MKAEIIAVGTELLLGQISNTNGQWISQEFASIGIPVFQHSVVGDNMKRVEDVFHTAHSRSDVIVVTGGLGPTEDDLTREAAHGVIGQKLIEDQDAMKKIAQFYEKNKQTMTANNRKQALVFEKGRVLPNEEGMAPGQIVEHEGRVWIFLPGVPSEMKSLMKSGVVPYLQRTYNLQSDIVSEMMYFIGIGESTLENKLSALILNQTNPTLAPLASEGEVGLRITATGETGAEARQKISKMKETILQIVGSYYYGSDDVSIESTVRDLLKERGYRLGAAESLTGGQFIEQLITLPGASAVTQGSLVAYTPLMKEKVIGVPPSLIEQYGTISYECAENMVLNAQRILDADVAVSFTGVAGPDSSEGHEPGTVFIGLQIEDKRPYVYHFQFQGGRDKIRSRAVKKGYELIFHHIKDL
ncbi:competence/damage-inducible protein A [Halobacillus sp. K22]|uniref:competence/damage-inducible protein A n=1 Tax=Halobacillus sp. K22 TaxID=3457431 RepID=UPI003FCE7BA6